MCVNVYIFMLCMLVDICLECMVCDCFFIVVVLLVFVNGMHICIYVCKLNSFKAVGLLVHTQTSTLNR